MHRVFLAKGTIFLHFNSIRIVFLVLGRPIHRLPRRLTADTGNRDHFTHDEYRFSRLDFFSGCAHVRHDAREAFLSMIFIPCAETESVIQRFSSTRKYRLRCRFGKKRRLVLLLA
jgi:hypothetical protein